MYNPFKKRFSAKEEEVFAYLSKIPLFATLTDYEKSLFIPYLHERAYKNNEVIFLRNDPSHALYLLRSGDVELNIEVNGKFEKLAVVNGIAAIGESCLIKNSKRLLNAVTSSEEAYFYVIPQVNIQHVFEGHLKLKVKMYEALAELSNNYNSKLFSAYKASLGFFTLGQMYRMEQDDMLE